MNIPLAEQLRPKTIDDIVGQEHLVGPDGVIRKLLSNKFLPSLIFWGPPGVGKTTLAQVLAETIDAHFEAKSAVTSGLADIRTVVKESAARLEQGIKTIVFI